MVNHKLHQPAKRVFFAFHLKLQVHFEKTFGHQLFFVIEVSSDSIFMLGNSKSSQNFCYSAMIQTLTFL